MIPSLYLSSPHYQLRAENSPAYGVPADAGLRIPVSIPPARMTFSDVLMQETLQAYRRTGVLILETYKYYMTAAPRALAPDCHHDAAPLPTEGLLFSDLLTRQYEVWMQVICESCLTGGKHVQQRLMLVNDMGREREREKSGDVGLVDLWVMIFHVCFDL